MAHPQQVVVIGAHILPYFNGKLLGQCAGFDIISKTEFKDARGIDIPYVLEHMPTIVEVAFSITLVRTIGDGGAQGAGIVAQQNVVSRMKYFTVLLKDRRSDLAVFKADQCSATSERWVMAPRDRVIGTVTCKGILWTNEAPTQ